MPRTSRDPNAKCDTANALDERVAGGGSSLRPKYRPQLGWDSNSAEPWVKKQSGTECNLGTRERNGRFDAQSIRYSLRCCHSERGRSPGGVLAGWARLGSKVTVAREEQMVFCVKASSQLRQFLRREPPMCTGRGTQTGASGPRNWCIQRVVNLTHNALITKSLQSISIAIYPTDENLQCGGAGEE